MQTRANLKKRIRKSVYENSTAMRVYFFLKHRIVIPMRFVYGLVCARLEKRGSDNDSYHALEKMRNTHTGEKCIIVGNGPSVRMDDLQLIMKSGMDSFGANRIIDIFPKTGWRPTYLSVMDSTFITSVDRIVEPDDYIRIALENGVQWCFLTSIIKKYVSTEKSDKRIIWINTILSPLYTTMMAPFSNHPELYLSDMGNVTHFSIQLASFLGYDTIYLYGMDNTYIKYLNNDGKYVVDNSVESHTAGIKTNVDDEHVHSEIPRTASKAYQIGGFADKRKNDLGYLKCKEQITTNGGRIINLTRGGALECFERQKFDSVFH